MTTVLDIAKAMQSLEVDNYPTLRAINPGFVAKTFLPQTIDAYPVSFRMPPEVYPYDYATGQRGVTVDAFKPIQFWTVSMDIALMVGKATNSYDVLIADAERYIEAFYQIYLQGYRLGGLVTYCKLGLLKVGKFNLRDAEHFGFIISSESRYRRQDQVGP